MKRPPHILCRKNRILLKELVKTDFKLRYQGSVLGYLWAVLRPLLMFAILYLVFAKLLRFGDDIDFSLRIFEAGCSCRLFPEAWVWHKRRTDFRKFFRQVYNSGIARINLAKRHPGSLKPVHLLPTLFTVGVIALVLASAAGRLLMHYDDLHRWYWLCAGPWLPIMAYSLLIAADSTARNRSLKIGLLSVGAAFVQLMGYGFGFIEAWWKRCVRGKDEFQAFEKNFYK